MAQSLEPKNLAAENAAADSTTAERRRAELLGRVVYVVTFAVLIVAAGYFVFAFQSNQNRVANLYLAKGKALMRQDEFGEAAVALQKARLADPKSLQIQTEQLKTEIFQIAKRSDSLDRLLDLEVLDQAEMNCKQLLSQDPGSAELTALLGIVYAHKDQPALAIETYKKAIEMNSAYPNVRNYWGRSAVQWQFPDNWKEVAAQKFREAQELDSTYAAPAINLARSEYMDKNYQGAIDILSRNEQIGRNNEIWYTLWGAALDELGRKLGPNQVEAFKKFSEALDKYRIAEALNPNYAVVHYNKAYALADLKRAEAAIAEYQKAVELEPGLAFAQYQLATVLIGRNNPERADREQALIHLKEAIRITLQTIEQYKYRKRKTTDAHAQKMLDLWMTFREKEKTNFEGEVRKVESELTRTRGSKDGKDK